MAGRFKRSPQRAVTGYLVTADCAYRSQSTHTSNQVISYTTFVRADTASARPHMDTKSQETQYALSPTRRHICSKHAGTGVVPCVATPRTPLQK